MPKNHILSNTDEIAVRLRAVNHCYDLAHHYGQGHSVNRCSLTLAKLRQCQVKLAQSQIAKKAADKARRSRKGGSFSVFVAKNS